MKEKERQDFYSEEISEIVINEYMERQRESSRRRRLILRLVCIFFGLLLFFGVLLTCGILFFKVDTVTVTGSTIYPDEWILRYSGIEMGENIFLLRNEDVAKKLGDEFPFIYSVRLDKHLPGSVELVIFEETPYFYFVFEEEYVVVSKDMKVLDITTDPEYLLAAYSDLRRVEMPGITYAITGEYLVFADEANKSALQTVLSVLETSPLGESVHFVDLRNRFDIKLSYRDGQFEILLGNAASAEIKLSFAKEIIDCFAQGTKGTVCVDDIASGYAIVDDPRNLLVS